MHRDENRVIVGFFKSLLVNTAIWGGAMIGAEAIGPGNQVIPLLALAWFTFIWMTLTEGPRGEMPPYRPPLHKVIAWVVTICVWGLMALASKGPIKMTMMGWYVGIGLAFCIICILCLGIISVLRKEEKTIA